MLTNYTNINSSDYQTTLSVVLILFINEETDTES